jgi:hypothetical protein
MKAIVAQPSTSRDLLPIFAAQARILAERAERGLSIDFRSVLNLLRLFLSVEGDLDDERLSPHPIVTPILLQVRDFPTRLHAFCTDLEGIREERRPR